MKKIAFSLIALAALATASFAGNRSYELRESDTYFGKYSEQVKDSTPAVNAFAVANDGQALTNFERMKKISEENEHGRH
jgi:hypothetical protein